MTAAGGGDRPPAVVGIVPAAGSGRRFAGAPGWDGGGGGEPPPKTFALLKGRPLIDWSTDVLRAVCGRVVAAVPPGHEAPPDRIRGGSSRSASVRLALAAVPEAEIAVVHDAARPLLTRELVERCIAVLEEDGVDGAVAAARVTDTIKEADPRGRVIRTLDRSALWAVQTPQVFRADVLRRALDVGDAELAGATDDAFLVEAAGGTVVMVEAPRENLKITTLLDLWMAESILALRASGGAR